MASALEHKLIVVTGKGGVGKTTMAAAVGLLAAHRGLRTIVVEVSGAPGPFAPGAPNGAGTSRLSTLLGHSAAAPHGLEVELGERLWGLSIDRDRVLAEWLRALGGRVPARVLTSSSSFQYLIAAAPGAREMLSMVKVWELAEGRRPLERATATTDARANRAAPATRAGDSTGKGSPAARAGDYDLVVLDAPATGHALAMLRSPQIFSAIARVGPIARQARQVRELLEDPARTVYLAVAQATEMAVTETLELQENLRVELGRELHAVVVNCTLPRRFESEELRRIAALDGAATGRSAIVDSAVRSALAVHERARSQQRQIARLRRAAAVHGSPRTLRIPYIFQSELDRDALHQIVNRLARDLCDL